MYYFASSREATPNSNWTDFVNQVVKLGVIVKSAILIPITD